MTKAKRRRHRRLADPGRGQALAELRRSNASGVHGRRPRPRKPAAVAAIRDSRDD
jgi:hypothetical protein